MMKYHCVHAHLIQSQYNQPLVFVGVGRLVDLKEEMDVSSEPYYFIVTEGIQLVGENVTYLPVAILVPVVLLRAYYLVT